MEAARKEYVEALKIGRYFIRDLLEAFGQNGDSPKEKSLEAHGRLEANKARLTELEIEEKEKVLIRKEPITAFMKGLAKVLYSTVEGFDLGREQTAAVCHAIGAAASDYLRSSGAPLLTLYEINEARRAWPHLESDGELWARIVCHDYEARSEQRRGTRATAAGPETT